MAYSSYVNWYLGTGDTAASLTNNLLLRGQALHFHIFAAFCEGGGCAEEVRFARTLPWRTSRIFPRVVAGAAALCFGAVSVGDHGSHRPGPRETVPSRQSSTEARGTRVLCHRSATRSLRNLDSRARIFHVTKRRKRRKWVRDAPLDCSDGRTEIGEKSGEWRDLCRLASSVLCRSSLERC